MEVHWKLVVGAVVLLVVLIALVTKLYTQNDELKKLKPAEEEDAPPEESRFA